MHWWKKRGFKLKKSKSNNYKPLFIYHPFSLLSKFCVCYLHFQSINLYYYAIYALNASKTRVKEFSHFLTFVSQGMTGPVLGPKLVADDITAEWHDWRKDVFNKFFRTGFELKCLVLFFSIHLLYMVVQFVTSLSHNMWWCRQNFNGWDHVLGSKESHLHWAVQRRSPQLLYCDLSSFSWLCLSDIRVIMA